MSLIRLIYSSQAELDLRLTDVKEILETARANNQALGVCGMLFYNSKYFLQALEGEEGKVMLQGVYASYSLTRQ
ncbi:MAG: BLUF domain-containing protein [Gammaproteobacteria bacterium]